MHRLLDEMDPFHHRICRNHLIIARGHPVHRPIIARADHDQLRPIDEILRDAIDQTEFTDIFDGFCHENPPSVPLSELLVARSLGFHQLDPEVFQLFKRLFMILFSDPAQTGDQKRHTPA